MTSERLSQAVNRRQLMRWAVATGAVVSPALRHSAAAAQASPTAVPEQLTIGYYDWIPVAYRSPLSAFNDEFAALPIASRSLDPLGGASPHVTEAEDRRSSYDFVLGTTPFVQLRALVDAGAIEPWDPYLPDGLLEDLPAAIRAEGSFDGKL
jgi:hypothetical protein